MGKEILLNKRALHDFRPLETFEAGLILTGPEVKSIKNGRIDFKGAYVTINGKNEPILTNFHIGPYAPAKREQINYSPLRPKKMLLTKKQINYLAGKQKEAGLTILPLKVYTKNKLVKAEIGVCKGKKKYDKREMLKKRDIERKMRREMRKKV